MAATDDRYPRSLLPPLPSEERAALPVDPPTEESSRHPEQNDEPPRRRDRRTTEDGRRLSSAGHAVVVAALALGIGLLFNAPGTYKSSYNQPDGWQRDVATTFTGPLKDVSHALYLDRPRDGVKALIGRSDDDDIDVEIALPATPAPQIAKPATAKPKPARNKPKPAATPKPAKPVREMFTPQKKLRLWIAGDSLVITPGYSIVRAAGASPVIQPVGSVDGRISTGLARPDVFNWFEEIAAQVKQLRPKVVVLAFGANDDKAYMTGLPAGVSIDEFGSPSWVREYRRRVGGVMDTVVRSGAHLVWIGLPVTRSSAQTQRFDVVNAAVLEEARRRPKAVTYVDTYSIFAAESGGYSDYRTTDSGKQERVRAGDGVHFERAGGNVIAREVLKRLNEVYDLTSWRSKGNRASQNDGTG